MPRSEIRSVHRSFFVPNDKEEKWMLDVLMVVGILVLTVLSLGTTRWAANVVEERSERT